MTFSNGIQTSNVATPSAERNAMSDDVDLIADILAGLPAMRASAGKYLPPYSAEDKDEWRRRVDSAPWRAEFADAVSTLSGKPFSKPARLPADAPAAVLRFAKDVTGNGDDLHSFSKKLFEQVVACGVMILGVGFSAPEWTRTRAEQKKAGARPYWFAIHPRSIIAAYENERRELVHVRWMETRVERDGPFGEKETRLVFVYEPGRWERWAEVKDANGATRWKLEAEGKLNGLTLPLVRIRFGEPLGVIRTRPPLRDLADMQIELWRALSRLDETLTYSGSPMLSASGVDPISSAQGGTLKVGPKSVLFAPEHGKWSYVQPDADVLREVREHVRTIIEDMQRLAMQPTLARAVASTATEVALASFKAHSVLEAWTLSFQNALETALALTTPLLMVWAASPAEERALRAWAPAVNLHADFDGDAQGATEANIVLAAAKAGVVSRITATEELQRRGVLGRAFDPLSEEARLAG